MDYDEEIEGRLAALEERVENMENEFELRIEKIVKDLQAKFGYR